MSANGNQERDDCTLPGFSDRTILDLFELQAIALPEQPAVVLGDVTLTYSELDQYASGTAGVLYEQGARKGDYLPLLTGGGLELPVAMIAAMKIGSPFVPIDNAWPQERIRTILAQLRPRVVITGKSSGCHLPPGIQWLRLDLSQPPPASAAAPLLRPVADDLIYGFFTSGSTGTPKCALNLHRGLLNRFLYMTREFGSDGQVVLQNSHYAFDSSIWQILWPITRGGRVIIPDRRGILDLDRTIGTIARHQVTMTDFVPSVFNTLTAMLAADPRLTAQLASLRRILIGGEKVDGEAVRTLRCLLPLVQITNTYGPTEASIGSIFHNIAPADGDCVPLGRPIDNTYAVILNDRREPVPTGQTGEIYIGGDCLGAGYLDDQEKTAAAFVSNPLPQIPGPLLYRTGDLGYLRADGLFMFVGRADDQVKVGGVRIELAEVELALSKHPAVRQAKVIVRGDTLIGFVAADAQTTPAALTEHVRTLLPASLVPRRIIVLNRLPLTPNGKVDRQELARKAGRVAALAEEATLNDTEQAVKQVWLDLLQCDDVGTTQRFFDVGGDSLNAQRLALALKSRFGSCVTVHDIVRASTIRDQAALITGGLHRSVTAERQDAAFLLSEVRLPEDIACSGSRPSAVKPHRFLLTGATGFIGAHLLHELVRQRADATVYCLVRSDGVSAAREKLGGALDRYRLPASALRNAIAVPGDLSCPRLGLDQAQYARLAGSVDAIIHNGALVNLIMDYMSHHAANVAGTTEVVRFAALGVPKHLHYVSTLSVVPVLGSGEPPVLEHELGGRQIPEDGYSQSKWVAEKILALARSRGIPATVYRLGEVMPRSAGGPPNPRSVLYHLLRACVRTGLRFATQAVTDWTPVDTVSQFIATAAVSGRTGNGYFHLLLPSGTPVAHVMQTLAENVPLSEVPYSEFWASLHRVAQGDGDRDLLKLLSLLPQPQAGQVPELLTGVFSDAALKFETTQAARLATESGMFWPAGPDDAAIAAYCRSVLAPRSAECDRFAPATKQAGPGCQ